MMREQIRAMVDPSFNGAEPIATREALLAAQHQALFAQVLPATLIVDPALHVIDANLAAASLLGRPRDALLHLPLREVLTPVASPPRRNPTDWATTPGTDEWQVVVLHLADGARLLEACITSPLGASAGYVVTLRQPQGDTGAPPLHSVVTAPDVSEVLVRHAFANAPVGIALVSLDGTFLGINRTGSQIFGYPEQMMVGSPAAPFLHPEDLAKSQVMANAALAGGNAEYSLEHRIVRPDGEIAWVLVHSLLVRGTDDVPRFFLAQFEDITTYKAAQQALTVSEDLFHVAFANAPVGMAVVQPDGVILRVNQAACDIFGYSEADLLTTPFTKLTHPDDRDASMAFVQRGPAGEHASQGFENRHIRKDGHVIWTHVHLALVSTADGETRYMLAHIQDITARKAAEAEHLATLHDKQQILQHVTDGFFAIDRKGQITYVNPAAEAMFGRTQDELVGRVLWEVLPSLDDAPQRAAFVAAIQGRKTFVREILYPTAESTYEMRVYPYPAGVAIYLRDISASKALERELREALAAAHAANHASNVFLGMMSHELRTPLQAVLGYSDLLLAGPAGSLSSEQAEDVRCIHQAASRLIQLIDQLLDLSRLQAGRLSLAMEPVQVAQVVEQVRQDIAPQAAAKALLLEFEVPSTLPPVLADFGRLRQILLNLVGNGVKFTHHGSVRIAARTTRAGVEIAVSDTGIGIPEHALSHIFEEFHQADPSTTRRYGGAGLGLAIARRLVEEQGGQISVSSRPGAGSTFIVNLPVARLQNGRA